MQVREIMVQPVVTVGEATTLDEAARTMLERDVGSVVVVDAAGKLSGLVTESDFTGKERGVPFSAFRMPRLFGRWVSDEGVERIYQEARDTAVREIMSAPVVTVHEDDSIALVIRRMVEHRTHHVPVVRDDVPVGMVTRRDLLQLMLHRASDRW